MGISLGMVGLGSFGNAFARLFKSHPLVDRFALCDREPERIRKFLDDPFFKDKLSPKDLYYSLEDACRSDLDALVVITQPWLHAPQCVKAMESGKHVYSAVPLISVPDGDEILDWCSKIIDCSRRTGMLYMLGETTIYRPQTMFCRRMAAAGRFGDFVYAEGEYCHDLDAPSCSLRKVQELRTGSASGKEWLSLQKEYIGRGKKNGPMYYPTHSVSGPVSVMKARPRKVSANGYRNRNGDPFFKDSDFSDISALFHMDNGTTLRVNEFREASPAHGWDETFRIIGTSGSFSMDRWSENGRREPGSAKAPEWRELCDAEMRNPLPDEVAEAFKYAQDPNAKPGDDFTPQGHGGSHPYLVHEFCSAVSERRIPEISAWDAALYMAMGVSAHKSALLDGELVKVPDFGAAPR